MNYKSIKRILIFSLPIIIFVFLAIPKNFPTGQTAADKRQVTIINAMNCLHTILNFYVYDNKMVSKDINELFNYARKNKFERYISPFIGKDSTIRSNFDKNSLELIKITKIPENKSDKIFYKVGKDANIAYYISQKNNYLTITTYIINSYGQFLVDSKKELVSIQYKFKLTK